MKTTLFAPMINTQEEEKAEEKAILDYTFYFS